MHAYTLRPYTDTRQDAARLAVLWDETKALRPGATAGSGSATVEELHNWVSHERSLYVLVADDLIQDRFLGLAAMRVEPDNEKSCDVSTLAVHPAVRDGALARQMLTHLVDKAGELGYHRVSLSRSSVRLASAPQYEEVGFLQEPDARDGWSNYVPLVRQSPVSKRYFRRHNWSATLQCDYSAAHQGRRPGAGSALRYHWRADEEMLLAVIDRDAEMVTGIETERFAALVEVDRADSDRAGSRSVRWRVTNKETHPLNVSIFADGDGGVKITHRSALIIGGGQEQTVEGRLTLSPDLVLAEGWGPVPRIATVLVIGAEIVELGAGVKPCQARRAPAVPSRAALSSAQQSVSRRHAVLRGQPA